MDNFSQQIDEIEALAAIYGDDWQVEDEANRAFSMNIHEGDNAIKLYVKMTDNYPTLEPPYYELSAPHLNSQQKNRICQLLNEVYLSSIGQPVLFQWIEKIREELQAETSSNFEINPPENIEITPPNIEKQQSINNNEKCPDIHHGNVIVDRKSSFQGHVAQIHSVEEVKLVIKKLLEIKKIAQATHNIYAYRIYNEKLNIKSQDCEDDGESQAGGRLLHFLQIADLKNVIVVVSRWYGGIHLGPERFRHINNAARQALEAANLISKNKDHKK